ELQVGKADLQHQQERHQQEQRQPDVGHADGELSGAGTMAGKFQMHRRLRTQGSLKAEIGGRQDASTVPASWDQVTKTSSSTPGASDWLQSRLGTLASMVWPASRRI